MQHYLRKYGVETIVNFCLYEVDGVDLRVDAADGGTDCTIRKDQGADATCTNDFVDEGLGYSLTLAAAEMQAAEITVYIVDSVTKVWLDEVLKIETYGNASAEHSMDFDDADGSTLTEVGGDGAQLTETQVADGSIIAASFAADAIVAATLATGAISADAFAADAIVAATLATNAITADGLAADAAVQIAAAVWDRVLTGVTHNIATSAGRRLRTLAAQVVRADTAQAGAAGSITLDAAASATDQLYTGDVVIIVDGTGVGQSKTIVNYNGTTKVASIHGTWFVNPANDSDFVITASKDVQHTSHGFAQAGAAGSITLEAGASAVNDFYKAQEVHLVSGTGTEQARLITAYNGTTKVATVATNWATNPDATTVYHTLASAQVDAALIEGGDATDAINAACDTAVSDYAGPTKVEMDTAHGLLATEAKQDIIDTNVDQIETAVITNAAGVDVAADIIALKAVADGIPTTAMRGTDSAATEAKQDIIDTNVDQLETAIITNAAGVDVAADIIAVKAVVDGIPTTAMRGTDSAALASVATEARLAELDAANLPTDVAAIPTTAMRGTDSAALASVATETRLAELDAANLPANIDTINTNAARLTAARAAVLTDLINGGRLDLLIDAIKAKTDNLPEGVKKNTALLNFPVVMVLTSDHVTPATGKTVTGQRSIDGGAFASVTGAIAEVSNGLYQFDAAAADTNGNIIVWRFSETDCDDTWVHIKTEE